MRFEILDDNFSESVTGQSATSKELCDFGSLCGLRHKICRDFDVVKLINYDAYKIVQSELRYNEPFLVHQFRHKVRYNGLLYNGEDIKRVTGNGPKVRYNGVRYNGVMTVIPLRWAIQRKLRP